METNLLTQNPFAVLTFIVAPAILTNATSVLAMSTINRMLRTRERMHEMFRESENATLSRGANFLDQVNRVERQAFLLLSAMRWIYVSLGAFAAASLVTLLGAVSGQLGKSVVHIVIGAGLPSALRRGRIGRRLCEPVCATERPLKHPRGSRFDSRATSEPGRRHGRDVIAGFLSPVAADVRFSEDGGWRMEGGTRCVRHSSNLL
jgi:hypothetical protein